MKESPCRAVRTLMCLYDFSRLFFLISLIAVFLRAGTDPGGSLGAYSALPEAFIAAPNALFPLMSLFLLLRLRESLAFVPLYITGKLICVAALAGWLAFGFFETRRLSQLMVWSFFPIAADLGTVLGMILVKTEARNENNPDSER